MLRIIQGDKGILDSYEYCNMWLIFYFWWYFRLVYEIGNPPERCKTLVDIAWTGLQSAVLLATLLSIPISFLILSVTLQANSNALFKFEAEINYLKVYEILDEIKYMSC